MSELSIPRDVIEKQRTASDPRISTWVSANAGAGKTHVLAQRVIRLLLDGCHPGKVLCLTYTKAAAANMANRVFDTLAKWTRLDDADLDKAIADIGHRNVGASARLRARRLFAAALETPGGLKVHTIHAFCTRVLHQFPVEARVPARFDVLEERAESELLDRLRLAVLTEAAEQPGSPLARALNTAIATASDTYFADIVQEAIGKREALSAFVADCGGVEPALLEVARALGLEEDDTLARVAEEILSSPILPPSEWDEVAGQLNAGSKTDCDQAFRLRQAAASSGIPAAIAYLSVFFADAGTPRKTICTKAVDGRGDGLAALLLREQKRLTPLADRRRAVIAGERTEALLRITHAILERYEHEKQSRALLDYDDLIDRTLALFDTTSAAWVLFKLDQGIDHVLVDEAQDTSPKQWAIIKHLLSEVTAGEGARASLHRTVFAVGDEKQSIFSFRGAAPREFDAMRKYFGAAFAAIDAPWIGDLKFERSFRSLPRILEAVDAVFTPPHAHKGLTATPAATVHSAIRDQAPGNVELWPLIKAESAEKAEAWDEPFNPPALTRHTAQLAERIARRVRAEIRSGRSPGEFLVLVRQRGALFEGVIRALKSYDVPVAGADRLILTEHVAVMDLMALADALLLPHDDLALACVLKSPLFGITEDQLFALAHDRGRKSLWRRLEEAGSADPAFGAISAELQDLRGAVRRDGPFTFYARLLGAKGGRAKFAARLGREADDVLDEFLAHALQFERREIGTVQGFMAWLRAGSTEVKRDMDIVRDEVRVMTVHGAKGLEAPVVILADTTTKPEGPRHPRVLEVRRPQTPHGAAPAMVWAAARATDCEAVAHARAVALERTTEEHARLLYVALTRAEDKLVVCGAEGVSKRPEGCWWDLVHDALADELVPEPAADGDGEILHWRKAEPLPHQPSAEAAGALLTNAPAWLRTPLAARPPEVLRVRPSHAHDAQKRRRPSGPALVRGRLVHRLLQSLPDVPAEAREAVTGAFLARHGGTLPQADRSRVAAQVLEIVSDPRFAALFGAGSRAEASIVGRLPAAGRALHVSGQVDRLVVTRDFVLVADFKTDADPPSDPAAVPAAYVAQLALYRGMLRALYPGRPVRAALVWTAIPALTELAPETLDSALAALLQDAEHPPTG